MINKGREDEIKNILLNPEESRFALFHSMKLLGYSDRKILIEIHDILSEALRLSIDNDTYSNLIEARAKLECNT